MCGQAYLKYPKWQVCSVFEKCVLMLMFYMLINMIQTDSIIFDGFGQACPKYPGKFAISLWHLKKEVRNEVRDLTVLAGSNTFTICYTSNILPPLTHFLSQYGVHKKPFLYLIICVILSKGRYMQVDLFAKILTYYKTGLRHAYFWKCYLKFHCPKVRDLEVYESKKILFQVIKVWYCLQYFFAHEN